MSETAALPMVWQPEGTLRLPTSLSDAEFDEVERSPLYVAMDGHCPNCLDTGTFRYQGVEWHCPEDDYGHVAMRLFRRYCLSNIPMQYQRIGWSGFPHGGVAEQIDRYTTSFATARLSGAGWDIHGADLGVGKTWAATRLLKEVVKQGHSGWFTDFVELVSLFERPADEKSFVRRKLMDVKLLVIDDIRMPTTERQQDLYASKLEEVVRTRTNANLPTVTTTNMTHEEVATAYHRVYSLLSAKQIRVELSGNDARLNEAFRATQRLVATGEVAPIA